jgi:hypothetical protein
MPALRRMLPSWRVLLGLNGNVDSTVMTVATNFD